jgi:hypothetical protein
VTVVRQALLKCGDQEGPLMPRHLPTWLVAGRRAAPGAD